MYCMKRRSSENQVYETKSGIHNFMNIRKKAIQLCMRVDNNLNANTRKVFLLHLLHTRILFFFISRRSTSPQLLQVTRDNS